MSDHHPRFSIDIEMMYKVFKVSRASYYKWLRSGPSERWKENEKLLVEIMDAFEESDETYGSPRKNCARNHKILD